MAAENQRPEPIRLGTVAPNFDAETTNVGLIIFKCVEFLG